jgi:uncharacterized protein
VSRKAALAGDDEPTETDRQEVRLAALLHDCAHGIFSHASESVAGEFPGIQALITREALAGSGAYEALAHMLVRAAAFGRFLDKLKALHPAIASVDQRRIADLIVGRASDDRRYLAAIISGPFDADKLDYIARDSRASGIEFSIDLPRLLYGIEVRWIKPAKPRYEIADAGAAGAIRTLLLRWSATQVLEQILFAKVQLFLLVYHHSKVRAAETLARQALRRLRDEGLLESPLDLLRGSDESFIRGRLPGGRPATDASAEVQNVLNRLELRRLPRRAAVLSMASVLESDTLALLVGADDKHQVERDLAEIVREKAGLTSSLDVLVDLPSIPPLTEVARSVVIDQNEVDVISLNDVFSGQDWFTVYTLRKWRGHVFGPAERAAQRQVFEAASAALDEIGITLDDLAATLARVPLA